MLFFLIHIWNNKNRSIIVIIFYNKYMSVNNIPTEQDIEIFLNGNSDKKYVTAIESFYNKNYVELVIHDKETGVKKIEKHTYKPFTYIKDLSKLGFKLFNGNNELKKKAMDKYKISIKKLITSNKNNKVIERLDNGYKFLVETTSELGYSAIQNFFKEGGIDVYESKTQKKSFTITNTAEDFLDKEGLIVPVAENMLFYNKITNKYEIIMKNVINIDSNNAKILIKPIETEEQKEKRLKKEKAAADKLLKASKPKKSKKDKANEEIEVTEVAEPIEEISNEEVEDSGDIDEDEEAKATNKKIDYENYIIDYEKLELEDENSAEKRKFEIYDDIKNNVIRYVITDTLKKGDKIYFYYNKTYRHNFFSVKLEEQFLIQTGIRLFKGYDFYDDVHKLIFDLETTGLYGNKGARIFLIGVKDNRGFEKIISYEEFDTNGEEKAIIEFFKIIDQLKPAIIYGYNSEEFDFKFILDRVEWLGIDLTKHKTTWSKYYSIYKKNKKTSVKFGGETHWYDETKMYGYNIIDILHAVKKAQAINSDIKEAGLKYICKKDKIAKPNRVYVKGDEIYSIYRENKKYIINKNNNEYLLIPDEYQNNHNLYFEELKRLNIDSNKLTQIEKNFFDNKDNRGDFIINLSDENITYGKDIINQYLLDDLWETLEVDKRYNEATFQLSKFLPCSYQRSATIGGAATWNLIMTAWSYEKNIAIPYVKRKPDFTGGLSRVFKLGFLKRIRKMDYSALYPSIELEEKIQSESDVTNVSLVILEFFKFNRDKFKKLAKDESLTEKERKFYDTKQLPLKIMNNSNFGALGSIFFNWSDFTCAEWITCAGRQNLRLMVWFFMQYDCVPLILDTDGVNYSLPEYVNFNNKLERDDKNIPIEEYIYINDKGKEIKGSDGYSTLLTDMFNKIYMQSKYMKLDDDGNWEAAINFSKKNYANLEYDKSNDKFKIKYVGNTIKSRTMSIYIEEFINQAIDLLIHEKPKEFVELYYDYLAKIYTKQIPLKKIAKKARIKMSVKEYLNRGTNKNGQPLPKQAMMELLIQAKIPTDGIDYVYVVNNGTAKSHGNTTINKKTGQFYSYMLSKEEIESDFDKLGDYNVDKYIAEFNARVEKLLVVFSDDVKKTLIKNDITTREYYTDKQLQMVTRDSDSIEELFTMQDKEVNFWNRSGLDPNKIFSGYKTNKPIITDYNDKLTLVRNKIKEKNPNLEVKAIYEQYNNDDIVLKQEKETYVIKEDGSKLLVPDLYADYYNNEFVKLPISKSEQQEYLSYFNYNNGNEDIKVEYENKYYLCSVVNGELEKIKQL